MIMNESSFSMPLGYNKCEFEIKEKWFWLRIFIEENKKPV